MRGVSVLCVAALAVAPVLADWPHEIKWDQLEPRSTWGGASFIDYDSDCYALTADDYLCSGLPQDQYVTDVEFYGWSWYGNEYIDDFRITFWSDVPATPEDASHPGELLWECQLPGEEIEQNRFEINLPTECWFDQGVGEEVVYWIGIQARMVTDGYPDSFYWQFLEPGSGWNDDAAFEATCWDYPPWYNWGWPTPDSPEPYDGPFPDGWYASADMSFRLRGIPEPASICLLGLSLLLLRRR